MILKIGSSDANTNGEVTHWQKWFNRYAKSYAPPVDGYFGNADADAVRVMQRNLARTHTDILVDGEFGDRMAAATGYKWKGTSAPPIALPRRPIDIYSAPGSGAPGWVGPGFQLGERAKRVLNINHYWIGYPIGGYLGFMGGDPKHSYNEVIAMMDAQLEKDLRANLTFMTALNARKQNPEAAVSWEGWFTAYSQSADGMRRAIQRMFGDLGPFKLLRDRINGLILFGDPSTPVTGISRLTFEPWLERLVTEINYQNDFYAVAKDKIRPAMFDIIVDAEMELPFFVRVLRIAMRVIPSWFSLIGLGSSLQTSGGLLQQAMSNRDEDVDDRIYELLSPTGILTSIIDLIGILGALPGLQDHGRYEFDPVMMDRAYDVMARFRR